MVSLGFVFRFLLQLSPCFRPWTIMPRRMWCWILRDTWNWWTLAWPKILWMEVRPSPWLEPFLGLHAAGWCFWESSKVRQLCDWLALPKMQCKLLHDNDLNRLSHVFPQCDGISTPCWFVGSFEPDHKSGPVSKFSSSTSPLEMNLPRFTTWHLRSLVAQAPCCRSNIVHELIHSESSHTSDTRGFFSRCFKLRRL